MNYIPNTKVTVVILSKILKKEDKRKAKIY